MTDKIINDLNNNLFKYLDRGAIIFAIVFFYMEIWSHNFAFYGGLPPIIGIYLIFIYGILQIAINPNVIIKDLTKLGFFWWLIAFFVLTVINYIIVKIGFSDVYLFIDDVFSRNLTALGFSIAMLVILRDKSNYTFAIKLLVFAVCFGALTNFRDIIDLTERWNGISLRAAGYYMNPNSSASVLALGFGLSVFTIRRNLVLPYFLIFLIGVLLTLSRGAYPSILFLMGLLAYKKSITLKSVLVTLLVGFITITIALNVLKASDDYKLLMEMFERNSKIQNRITGLLSPSEAKFDPGVRDDVALDHINYYLKSPILGHGLSSSLYIQTEHTETNHSSHVQYIHMLNEFGLLGLVIIFSLPFSMCVYRKRFYLRKELIVFTVIYLIAGVSSHNLYDLRSYLVSYALFGCLIMHSTGQEYENKELT